MFSLVYVSTATVPFSKADLQDLLAKSRSNNAALGVTGLLLFADGNFMQILEGEEATVRDLYRSIARDPRHAGTIVLLTERAGERAFGDWSMAFRDLNDPTVREMPGFSTFLNQSPDQSALFRDPTRAQRLLHFFKRSMR